MFGFGGQEILLLMVLGAIVGAVVVAVKLSSGPPSRLRERDSRDGRRVSSRSENRNDDAEDGLRSRPRLTAPGRFDDDAIDDDRENTDYDRRRRRRLRRCHPDDISEKLILPAFLLCFFVGVLGVHRFYLGKIATGVVMAVLTVTVVGLIATAVWSFVDLIVISCAAMTDGEGYFVVDWT
jgi:TM2 domain-containing membrane protein YozV